MTKCPLIDTCPRLVTKEVFVFTCLTDYHMLCLYYVTRSPKLCLMTTPPKGKTPKEWKEK